MATGSIEQRAFRNTAVGLLSFLATMGQTVALVPILLRVWGTTTYGLWLTLMAGFSLLQTLDLGHQNYVGNRLNMQYHTDLEQFRRTLGSGILMACVLGVIELGLTVAFITTGILPRLLGVNAATVAEHQLGLGLLVLMMMWVTFGSIGGIIVRILIPAGFLYESQWFGIAIRLSQFLTIAGVAYGGGGILAACAGYALVQSLMSLVVFRYIRRRMPGVFPWWEGAQWRVGLNALRKSLVLTFNSVGQQLSNNGLIILVSLLFAAALIPVFTTLRTLTNTAVALTTIFVTALFPDMIRFQVTRQAAKLADVFNTNWFVSGALVNFGIVLMLPIVAPVYQLWTRGHLPFHPSLFLVLAASISLTNFGAGLIMYLQGINDLRSQTLLTVVRAGLIFLLGYGLSGYFGILSIGIGVLAGEVLASMMLPIILVNRHLAAFSTQLGRRHLAIAATPPALLMVACVAAIGYGVPFGVLTLGLVPLLAATYYCNWLILSGDVRARIMALGLSLVSRKAE